MICAAGRGQDHPQEKEMKTGKMVSEEVLQTAEKRREAKGERKRQIYSIECRVAESGKEI